MSALGLPRRHERVTESTNALAQSLAGAGAPHGTLVTAREQRAGRGRQGRRWHAPGGSALLTSLVLRDPAALLALLAAVAVAETVERISGERAGIKWPNDVLLDDRKVAGILIEGRPHERWAVLGIGLNVAVAVDDLPAELRDSAGTLGRRPDEIELALEELLAGLARWLDSTDADVLASWLARDVLAGKPVRWSDGSGLAAGIDDRGRLLVDNSQGRTALAAGEVHLLR